MSKLQRTFDFDTYHMRLIRVEDTERYFDAGFANTDPEANYYTGTTGSFTKEQVKQYVHGVVENETRYDFLITQNEQIIGEVVLSDMDCEKCHYRICIFKKENFSKGIGLKATRKVLSFAFEELGLEAVELEVFPFNERGLALYKKLGFEITGEIVEPDAEPPYKKIYTMDLKAKCYKG